jgi:hypothetical protein
MFHEFNDDLRVHIDRDNEGVARNVLHVEEPYLSSARTAQLAAREYLERFRGLLDIKEEELRNLSLPPETKPIDAQVEYRFLDEKSQFDMTTVVYNQTYLGLPIREAAVAVHTMQNPFRVVSAQSTRHALVDASRPSERAVNRAEKVDNNLLGKHFGLLEKHKEFDLDSLEIKSVRLIIYQYESGKRVAAEENPGPHREEAFVHEPIRPPLPEVAEGIRDGQHYVCAEVIFVLGTRRIPGLRWIAILEVETLSILFLRPLVDSVDGLVFKDEPATDSAGPATNASTLALNAARSSVLLRGLAPPLGGNYALTGDIIQVSNLEPPPGAPPIEPAGTDFNFDARTDNFSAVNAYYHCDRFFRLVKDLGFDLNVYFGGTIFPTAVDHRGSITSITGQEINAHCLGNGSFGILRTTFMLADLSNVAQPLGLACDYRVALHELGGHGILYNHVNFPNFGFSHSAGDSFGAILNDPESQAPDRFLTFPWVGGVIARRHDRAVSAGWGWNGVNNTGGYNAEQILCTSHFRIYRSIGGDSTEVPMRHFAARYLAYLILRTVGALTPATNPPNATIYAANLMNAEFGNWTSEGQVGGAYWKVIRWAFEKQGIYQPAAAPIPNNNIGSPPPVDVYIDDGRHGEYQYGPAGQFPYLQPFWETTDIWNRHEPDGHPEHQAPVAGKRNYAYAHIKNRGTQSATGVVVHAYHCRPTAGLVWPDDLKPMLTASLAVPGSIPPGGQKTAGPFEWKPKYRGHECMFMSVGAAGDRANNDPATLLPTGTGPTPLWRMVPCDNNQGLRAVMPVPGGGHRRALVESFRKRRFWASNPFAKTGKVEVRTILPFFLLTRGWAIHLNNPGGGTFSLGPRATRVIRPRLIGGQTFTAAEVTAVGEVAIKLVVLVDGLVVGGLTFVLDPHLTWPVHECVEEEQEHHHESDSHVCAEPYHERMEDDCEEHHNHEKRSQHKCTESCELKERESRRVKLLIDFE